MDILSALMSLKGLMGGNKGPNLSSIVKMLLPFLTDSNIQSVVPDLRAFIMEAQEKAGGHMVFTASLTDDGAQFPVRTWLRDPETMALQPYKELDLFSITHAQIKDFLNGIAREQHALTAGA